MKGSINVMSILILVPLLGQELAAPHPLMDSIQDKNDTGMMGDATTRFGRGGTNNNWQHSSNAARSRIVETKYGRIQGLSLTLFSNLHYSGNKNFPLKNKIVELFFGIPYAAPPTKSHRFSPTQTPVPWNDVKPTILPSPVCPQIFPDIRNETVALKEMPKGYVEYLKRIEPFLRNQSEDCLYLNIYSPIGPDAKPKPVLVYIHGGMYAWGSGTLVDGTVIAAYSDVIFVTINYRLNILGFLNLNDSPGSKPRVANYGLMDQIAALHWIKENVRSFGGDPENINLMGYEAGAACINFLMTSPTVSTGLFHRAILISGSSHAPWAMVYDPSIPGLNVAQSLNCSLNNNDNDHHSSSSFSSSFGETTTTQSPHQFDPVLECLKTKHFTDFSKFSLPKFSVDFGPSVDGIVIKPSFKGMISSLSGPQTMGRKREVNNKKYEILLGLSSLEKLTEFSETDLEFGFESSRRDAILRTLVRNSYRYHRNEILATITNEYIDWERTTQHPISTRDMVVNAVTDSLSLAPIVAITDSNLLKRAFFYVFEHSTKDGLYNYHRAGAGGGEELNYIFGYPLIEAGMGQVLPFLPPPLPHPSNYSKGEMALSELWMTYISNFAHTGSPNGALKIDSISSWPVSKERNRYKNNIWEPYDKLHQKYLEIGGNKIRIRSHYRAHQMAIWLRLIPELQRSGAQMASTFHNRMKGGNDPTLYAGRLKHPGEDTGDAPPSSETGGGPLNSAMLYDLLLGYGSQDKITMLDSQGAEDGLLETEFGGDAKGKKNPTLTMTTCYSPVSSSVQSGNNHRVKITNTTSGFSSTFSTNFFDPQNLPPYSVILAITLAIGCSLLILNMTIFALCYYSRGKRSRHGSRLLKSSSSGAGVMSSNSNQGSCESDDDQHNPSINKFTSEPPELLKNRTETGFLQHSQSHLQAEMEALEVLELTVKQHQRELMGEKALLSIQAESYGPQTLPRNMSHHPSSSPSMTITSSPRSSSTTQQGPMTISSTLPRCNGTLALGSVGGLVGSCSSTSSASIKPHPPPRGGGGPGPGPGPTLHSLKRVEYSDIYTSDSNNENEELKV